MFFFNAINFITHHAMITGTTTLISDQGLISGTQTLLNKFKS